MAEDPEKEAEETIEELEDAFGGREEEPLSEAAKSAKDRYGSDEAERLEEQIRDVVLSSERATQELRDLGEKVEDSYDEGKIGSREKNNLLDLIDKRRSRIIDRVESEGGAGEEREEIEGKVEPLQEWEGEAWDLEEEGKGYYKGEHGEDHGPEAGKMSYSGAARQSVEEAAEREAEELEEAKSAIRPGLAAEKPDGKFRTTASKYRLGMIVPIISLLLLASSYLLSSWIGLLPAIIGLIGVYWTQGFSEGRSGWLHYVISLTALVFLIADAIFLLGIVYNGLGDVLTPTGAVSILWLLALIPFQDPEAVWESSIYLLDRMAGGDKFFEELLVVIVVAGVLAGATAILGLTGISRNVFGIYLNPVKFLSFIVALTGPLAFYHYTHTYGRGHYESVRRAGRTVKEKSPSISGYGRGESQGGEGGEIPDHLAGYVSEINEEGGYVVMGGYTVYLSDEDIERIRGMPDNGTPHIEVLEKRGPETLEGKLEKIWEVELED